MLVPFGLARARLEFDVRFGAAPAVAAVVGEQRIVQAAVGGLLRLRLQRGAHAVAAGQRIVAELLDRLQADHLGQVRRFQLDRRLVRIGQIRLAVGGLVRGLIDEAVVEHPLQHVAAPDQCARPVRDRIAGGRELRDRGQHRAFGQRQLVERLAVIELGRRGDAVGAIAEEALVEIQAQDLVLLERVLDPDRQEHLGDLAREADLRAQEEIACDLLGDRRAARHVLAAGRDHQPDRARDAAEIDAAVAVEVGVLGGDEGLLELLGDLLDPGRNAPGLAECRDQASVGRIDPQRHLQADVAQGLHGRQPGRDQPVGDTDRQGAEQGSSQREVDAVTEQTVKDFHSRNI